MKKTLCLLSAVFAIVALVGFSGEVIALESGSSDNPGAAYEEQAEPAEDIEAAPADAEMLTPDETDSGGDELESEEPDEEAEPDTDTEE